MVDVGDATIIAAALTITATVMVGVWNSARDRRQAIKIHEKQWQHDIKMHEEQWGHDRGMRESEYKERKDERERDREEQKQEQENRKNQLSAALYSEMRNTYCTLVGKLKVLSMEQKISDTLRYDWQNTRNLDTIINILDLILENGFDVYKFTRKNPVLFYQLQDASGLDDMYRSLLKCINDVIREFRNFKETKFSEEEEWVEAAKKWTSLRAVHIIGWKDD